MKGGGHPFAHLSVSSRGVMNRRRWMTSRAPVEQDRWGSTDQRIATPRSAGKRSRSCRPLRGRPRAGRVDFPSMSALSRALHAGLLERVDRHHRVEGGREMRAGLRSRACSARHPTGWVHVTRPAAATATGRERCNLGKVADTPSPGFAGSRGVMNRRTLTEMKTASRHEVASGCE